MTRDQAIKHFGTAAELAEAIGISVDALYQWPKTGELSSIMRDRVIAACVCTKREVPKKWMKR